MVVGAAGGRGDARRAGRRRGLRLRLQDPGQHGPQPSRPDRLPAPDLGPVHPRHEAEGREHRPADERQLRRSCSSPPTASWPRRPIAGDVIGIPNHGVLRVGDSLSESGGLRFAGPAQLRAGNPAARAGQGSAQGQAPEEGAGGPGRGRRHPAVPADHRLGLHRRRRGPAAVRGDGRPAGQANTPSTCVFEPAPYAEARWLAGDAADSGGLHQQAPLGHGRGHRRRAGVPGQVRLGDRLCRRALSEGRLRAHPERG